MSIFLQTVIGLSFFYLVIFIVAGQKFYYQYYWNHSGHTYQEYVSLLLFSNPYNWVGAIGEELLFRGPLLFSDNIYLWYALNVTFGLVHYGLGDSLADNVRLVVFTTILGVLNSYITVSDGISHAIFIHLLNNFYAAVYIFARDYFFFQC